MRLKLCDLVQNIERVSDSIATGSGEIAQGDTDLCDSFNHADDLSYLARFVGNG